MRIAKVKSSVYKRVLGIFGAAGFLLTFQACYGTPQNYANVDGRISDEDSNEGIPGLRVYIVSDTDSLCVTTDSTGAFNTGIMTKDNVLQISVEDVDNEENGKYATVGTTLDYDDETIEIELSQLY